MAFAKSRRILVTCCGTFVAAFFTTYQTTEAHDRYNDGCQNCHGSFTGGTSPRGTIFPQNDKHEMHRNSSFMATACNLCHTTGDGRDPFLGSSNGTANNPGVGCTGCHGQSFGGTIGNSGVGLRRHHAMNGVTYCSDCHSSDPLPLPETARPIYYGTVDTRCDDPCNSGPNFRENWSVGDTRGLDTDGDDVVDGADSDCAPPCVGDLNGDRRVDISDLAILLAHFGMTGALPADGDLDGDADVDISDLALMLSVFGVSC
jgi:hypothetical protein